MTEYAIILATIAVVAYVAYQGLGTNISTMVNQVASDL
jgi:Flp pilus assembly pilin Flp